MNPMTAMSEPAIHIMSYRPRGAAVQLFDCHDREIMIEGPRGTGKTRCVCEWVCNGAENYPGSRTLLLRKTHASFGESVLATMEDQVIKPDWEREGGQRARRTAYKAPNGSRIVVAGLDNPDRLKSTDFDRVVFFEATEMTERDWETMLGSLRSEVMPLRQMVADCNPDSPYHWLNRRADRIHPLTKRTTMTRILSRHKDNPILYDNAGVLTKLGVEFMTNLNAMTGVRKKRLLDGIWAAAEGMVYDHYDPAVHLCSDDEVPKQFAFTVAGVDWGFINPGVILILGVDGDGRVWVVRQVYRTGQSIGWWCKMALILQRKWKCTYFFCDPSAPDKIDDFRRAGVPAIKAINDITLGISAVSKRLLWAGDEKLSLRILKGSRMTVDAELAEDGRADSLEQEFEGYVWEDAKEGVNFRERPIPNADHALDALRYGIVGVDRMDYMFDDSKSLPRMPRRID